MNPETRKSLAESIKQEILTDLQFQGGARSYGDNGDRPYGLKSTRQAYHDLAEAIWRDVLSGIGSIESFIERKIGRRELSGTGKGGRADQRLSQAEKEKIKRDVLNELQFAVPVVHSHRALIESIKREIMAEIEAQQETREESMEQDSHGRERQQGGTYRGFGANSLRLSQEEMDRIKRDVISDLHTRPESNYYANYQE